VTFQKTNRFTTERNETNASRPNASPTRTLRDNVKKGNASPALASGSKR
jgi:hypothetical protein